MSGGHFFHEPENGKASLCPVDIFFMSLKTEKRVYVQGTLIHEPEIDSSTLNRSNWSSSARFLESFLPRGS